MVAVVAVVAVVRWVRVVVAVVVVPTIERPAVSVQGRPYESANYGSHVTVDITSTPSLPHPPPRQATESESAIVARMNVAANQHEAIGTRR